MNEGVRKAFFEAAYSPNIVDLEEIIDENLGFLKSELNSDILFHFCDESDFGILKQLLRIFDINSLKDDVSVFNSCCSRVQSLDNLKWLINNGAKVNHFDSQSNTNAINGSIRKGDLEYVKCLVGLGVKYDHLFFRFGGASGVITEVQTVVDFAKMFGKEDVAEYFISLGVKPATKEQIDEYINPVQKPINEKSEFEDFVENEVGCFKKLGFGKNKKVEILVIEPNEDQTWQTLLTHGISLKAMNSEDSDIKYCELAIQLPPDWPLDKESLKKQENFWPIVWLRKLSNYPFENKILLKDQDTVSGEGSEPFAPNTKLNSFLLIQDPDLHGTMLSNNKFINIYTLIPLYHEECEDIKNNGVIPVLTKFEENIIGQTVEVDRPNVITGEGL